MNPILLALTQPIVLLLALFGINTTDDEIKTVMNFLVTIAGALSMYFAPSFRALFRHGKEAE